MDIQAIQAAYNKGHSPIAISKLLGVPLEQVEHALGLDDVPEPSQPVRPEFSKESMRALANEALHALLFDMSINPHAFKASEIVSAAREALDRTDGRAAQTVSVEAKTTVTHEHIMKLPPDEAYRMLCESPVLVDMGKITDAGAGGGDRETGAGGEWG